MTTPRYGRVNLSIAAITGDGGDADQVPDRVGLNGSAVLRPRLAPGGGEIGRGPGGDEIQVPLPVECQILDGVLTCLDRSYATLLVPTDGWFWEVTFHDFAAGDQPILLESFAFPVIEATAEQLADPEFVGTNIAPFASQSWQAPVEPAGAQRLAAEMVLLLGDGREVARQIGIVVGQASDAASAAATSARISGEKATAASESADFAAGRATAASNKATDAATSEGNAKTSETNAKTSESNAKTSETNAAGSASAAAGSAAEAREAADEFGLTFPTPGTVAPGAPATATVTRNGPHYTVQLGLPKGDKGDTGDPTTPATTSAIGSVQLAGNLAGTATAPQVTVPAATTGRQQLDAFASSVHAALPAKADLEGGKLKLSQLPDLAITQFLGEKASQSEMLALAGQRGDWCVRTDLGTAWILVAEPASAIGSWRQLTSPESPVQSVAGKTGAVTLAKSDVGLGNVDNTSDAAKPISTATQTALDGKAASDHTHTPASIGAEPASWQGTQAAYDALGTKDPARTYYIV